jgi:Ca2+-binding RTX toxin-like protein
MRINGTNNADSIVGNSTANDVLGAASGDKIYSGAGDDVVFAGSGNDTVDAGTGNDLVSGGVGNDVLGGNTGNDILIGGVGVDLLSGGVGDDILSGGSGNDTFQFKTNFGNDTVVDFQFGADKLNFYSGAFGNAKNVTVSTFAALQDVIAKNGFTVTDEGHDAVAVHTSATDSLTFLNAGSLFGFGSGAANNTGTSNDDVMFGTENLGGAIVGGTGNDTILSGSGNSLIIGGEGNDIVLGGASSDTIGGQAGDDTIFGGAGNDQLSGGADNDTITGDDGADTFRFSTTTFGHDVVTDLNFAEGDRLVFFAGSVAPDNVVVTDVAELVNLAANVATGFHVDGGNLTLEFGASSVTLAEFGDLVF